MTRVYCGRFRLDGTPDGAERALSAATGEAINGVLARRPTASNSANREYRGAWQYRADGTSPWQIRFSRLDREAQPMANPPGKAPPMPASDVTVIGSGTLEWQSTRAAIAPQLVCSYTHEPWANPPDPLPANTRLPDWSPS